MKIPVAKGHSDCIVTFLQHSGDIVGKVKRLVGGYSGVERYPGVLAKEWSQGVIGQSGHEEVVTDLAAVDPCLEVPESAYEYPGTFQALADLEFLAEHGIAGVPFPAFILLPRGADPLRIPTVR